MAAPVPGGVETRDPMRGPAGPQVRGGAAPGGGLGSAPEAIAERHALAGLAPEAEHDRGRREQVHVALLHAQAARLDGRRVLRLEAPGAGLAVGADDASGHHDLALALPGHALYALAGLGDHQRTVHHDLADRPGRLEVDVPGEDDRRS